ncbi:BTB/POZ domain-containing protein KCTD7-like isoform X1 [Haliotis rufescens]|uniref:BTB/POZ domain-containing protein KCTD7-like isoform X1 n=1 Tax=Haliotis rufescens TaxID=6454 RepID=UPI00201F3112|nr:BTB/POZ domain-containing protein KCTD7-like isoform X1 [Haliotis rufescens]
MSSDFPAVVDLNVGGRHLTTSLSTLTKDKDSKLAAMFSGGQLVNQDKDGRYFIDADGDVFVHVLNFLRYDTVPPRGAATAVLKYADYFELHALRKTLEMRFDAWRGRFFYYTSHLEYVKGEVRKFNFSSRYFYLCIRTNDCSCRNPPAHQTDFQGLGKIEIHLPALVHDDESRSLLLIILAQDLQCMDIFKDEEEKPSDCNCLGAMKLRFGNAPESTLNELK